MTVQPMTTLSAADSNTRRGGRGDGW